MAATGTDSIFDLAEVVDIVNRDGMSDVVLVCEHASNFVPSDFDGLGLTDAALNSHIAWDPGAMDVAMRMSELLNASLVAQKISRLVYDCNRPPEEPSSVPEQSEIYAVPGNKSLSSEARAARARNVYRPFHSALNSIICDRIAAGRPPVLVTIHSFTPNFMGKDRSVEIGMLHDTDSRLADALLPICQNGRFDVRRNAPYGPEDGVTHTLVEHGLRNGLINVMIEIRNDLIADAKGQNEIAEWLASCIATALGTVDAGQPVQPIVSGVAG